MELTILLCFAAYTVLLFLVMWLTGRRGAKGNEAFLNAIDDAYMKGYMSLTIVTSQSYNANSTANQINRMLGLNQQGTEIVRPNMFGNKYPWQKAKDLFGKVPGYGAQMPE